MRVMILKRTVCAFSRPFRNDPKKHISVNTFCHPPSPGTIPKICLRLFYVYWKGAKGITQKGHREKVLNVMNFRIFRVFSGCFQGVFRVFSGCFQGVFRVFSGCFQGVFGEFRVFSGCFRGVFGVFFPMPSPDMPFGPFQV